MGSYTLAIEPIGSTLLALAQRERQLRVISLDPNLRPAMVGSLEIWRERFENVARCATIIKLSEEDLMLGWGPHADIEVLVGNWLANGVSLVAMTKGASGATAWWPGGQVTLPGRTVQVVDAVGAGDSFHAALLARMAQQGVLNRAALAKLDIPEVEDAIRYANAAAAFTCSRRGADLPRRAEVEAALNAD